MTLDQRLSWPRTKEDSVESVSLVSMLGSTKYSPQSPQAGHQRIFERLRRCVSGFVENDIFDHSLRQY